MEKLKNKKSKGRPKFVPDTKQLRQLYTEIKKGNLTNEQGWTLIGCKHSKWFELKKKYEMLEVEKNVKSN